MPVMAVNWQHVSVTSRITSVQSLLFLCKKVLIKSASNLITPPNNNTSLTHPTATTTINILTHLKTPPYKKTLNLICPSYWMVEGQIRLSDASVPPRRLNMMHGFKGHDRVFVLAWPLSCATEWIDCRPDLDFYFLFVVWLSPEVIFLWKAKSSSF